MNFFIHIPIRKVVNRGIFCYEAIPQTLQINYAARATRAGE